MQKITIPQLEQSRQRAALTRNSSPPTDQGTTTKYLPAARRDPETEAARCNQTTSQPATPTPDKRHGAFRGGLSRESTGPTSPSQIETCGRDKPRLQGGRDAVQGTGLRFGTDKERAEIEPLRLNQRGQRPGVVEVTRRRGKQKICLLCHLHHHYLRQHYLRHHYRQYFPREYNSLRRKTGT